MNFVVLHQCDSQCRLHSILRVIALSFLIGNPFQKCHAVKARSIFHSLICGQTGESIVSSTLSWAINVWQWELWEIIGQALQEVNKPVVKSLLPVDTWAYWTYEAHWPQGSPRDCCCRAWHLIQPSWWKCQYRCIKVNCLVVWVVALCVCCFIYQNLFVTYSSSFVGKCMAVILPELIFIWAQSCCFW